MGYADPIKRMLSEPLARKTSHELQEEAARKTDAMRQYEYDVARQSILGEFSSGPISACYECIKIGKAARRKERLDLVSRAIVACPKHAAEAARLRQDMDEIENMRCAKHVYLANDPAAPGDLRENPPPGFKKATPEELADMGLTEKMLNPRNSNFRVAVYVKDPAVWGTDSKPGAVIAFRGSTPDEEDWQNDFGQDANEKSMYYTRALRIGNILAGNEADIHIVGHSLGGGLASAAQGSSGLTASTYNAAGLHPATVARFFHDDQLLAADPAKITAIRIKGEVLTKTQESPIGSWGLAFLANRAVGTKRDLAPSHDEQYLNQLKKDKKVDHNEAYDTYLHGMDEVIDSMENQKKRDEVVLKTCVGEKGG
jgi:hypothetical protein